METILLLKNFPSQFSSQKRKGRYGVDRIIGRSLGQRPQPGLVDLIHPPPPPTPPKSSSLSTKQVGSSLLGGEGKKKNARRRRRSSRSFVLPRPPLAVGSGLTALNAARWSSRGTGNPRSLRSLPVPPPLNLSSSLLSNLCRAGGRYGSRLLSRAARRGGERARGHGGGRRTAGSGGGAADASDLVPFDSVSIRVGLEVLHLLS